MPANTAAATGSKKMLLTIVGAVVVALALGGGVAWFVANRWHADDDEGGAASARRPSLSPPTFLPMENMVVNLSDPGGDRFAQIGITLELEDARTAELVRQYLPTIRSGILMLVSQRSSGELLQREGKERLAADILREVSRALGYGMAQERKHAVAEQKEDVQDRAMRGQIARDPVYRVLFSSFIIQ